MSATAPEPPLLPPPDLAKRRPQEVTLRAAEIVHRFFTSIHEPIFFDRGEDGRLNAPDGSYGVLYVAKSLPGAFAETFLRTPGLNQLPTDFLARKAYVTLTIRRPLKLAKMAGAGLARIGATAQVVHGGKPYDCPQAWSGAHYRHPAAFDGIAYYARHDDEALCYAIFERAEGAVREAARETNIDKDWFWDIAEIYGVGLAP